MQHKHCIMRTVFIIILLTIFQNPLFSRDFSVSAANNYFYSFLPCERSNQLSPPANSTKNNIILNNPAANSPLKSSVLSNGKWYKFGVKKSGIYKISYTELSQLGLDNLDNISVWGIGGKALPLMNNEKSYDDIQPIPILIYKGADNVFNQGDYILFYAEGPKTLRYDGNFNAWKWDEHLYSKSIFYFLTTSQTQVQIDSDSPPSTSENYSTNEFDQVTTFEKNDTNLVKSGREWFGEIFDIQTKYSYSIETPEIVENSTYKVWARMAARSSASSTFSISFNGQSNLISFSPVPISDPLANKVSVSEQVFTGNINDQAFNIELTYNKPNTGSVGFLDFISVQTRHALKYNSEQLTFRDFSSVGNGIVSKFIISNANSALQIWDVSNINFTKRIPISFSSGNASFKVATDSLRTFIGFEPDMAYSIEAFTPVENQDIKGNGFYEYFIVTHPLFKEYAEDLAQTHREKSNLSVIVYTTEEVYNEFSSGTPDVSAIRNMIRYFYRNASSDADKPKYLLLFGDGSFDNLSDSPNNTNFIPTYQSTRSINSVSSFVSDDFFGLLDDDEGESTGFLDIGVGRLPVSTTEQAADVVDKIKRYINNDDIDDWQSKMVFIGDDEDGNIHMNDANTLAEYIETNHPGYNVQKIFFDAYQQENTSAGQRYPDVTKDINDAVNRGALLVNYTGHGNERWLSHEKVLMLNDVLSWQNKNRLPLFVTATCEFSRFDDYHITSTGEWILLYPDGGAVALLSTTRLVYSSPNFTLNYNFIQQILNTDAEGKHYRLGDLVRITKYLSGTGLNKRNFSLLGDPALMLHYPAYKANITDIKKVSTNEEATTLKSLEKISISGEIVDNTDVRNTSFNGIASVTVFDKESEITTLANDGGNPMTFKARANVVFKGKATVTNGEFSIQFTVPKDINYSIGAGKICVFATDGTLTALGANDTIKVGGIGTPYEFDSEGPAISLYLNDEKFMNNGISGPNPKLLVVLSDPNGINTTGIGIGHDLTATIHYPDGSTSYVNLNDFYSATLDDYTQGTATYQLSNLVPGSYTVTVKAWDTFNNSSKSTLSFRVVDDNSLQISNFYCYPNPITDFTNFFFDSNLSSININVRIEIFNLNGAKVAELKKANISPEGFRIGPFSWNGRSYNGSKLPKGVYIGRLTVNSEKGTQNAVTKFVVF
ncbi:MAG: hypothetical protein PWR03_924 [Tenuifilum sp.]|nr:hypothetical protein [Tenuifilum sp.]